MRLLLDECMPRRLKREFVGHEVSTVDEAGLKGLKNGQLLALPLEHSTCLLLSIENSSENRSSLILK